MMKRLVKRKQMRQIFHIQINIINLVFMERERRERGRGKKKKKKPSFA